MIARRVPAMERLLILGASARSAAESALRAGYAPLAADLFADVDLRAVAPVTRVEAYPEGLLAAAERAPPGPWMYTGALENEPELVDRLAATRPLWGNAGASLLRARDPRRVAQLLNDNGLHAPETRLHPPVTGDPRMWLLKPRRSAGGRNVHSWDGSRSQDVASLRTVSYLQQRIEGTACSSVFVVGPQSATLIGSSEQLIGSAWCGARDFQFAGALGPLELHPLVTEQLMRLGKLLWRDFQLRGLVGVDWISSSEQAWIIEINPRYTATVEVLERSLGVQLIDCHARACTAEGQIDRFVPQFSGYCGKAIFYAQQDVTFPEFITQTALQAHALWNRQTGKSRNVQRIMWGLADIPAGGTLLRRATPVLTILAQASHREEVLATLKTLSAWLQQCLERQVVTPPPL